MERPWPLAQSPSGATGQLKSNVAVHIDCNRSTRRRLTDEVLAGTQLDGRFPVAISHRAPGPPVGDPEASATGDAERELRHWCDARDGRPIRWCGDERAPVLNGLV